VSTIIINPSHYKYYYHSCRKQPLDDDDDDDGEGEDGRHDDKVNITRVAVMTMLMMNHGFAWFPPSPIPFSCQSNIYKDFQYITYGKIFKIEHLQGEGRDGPSKLAVYISYGGLLMKLSGEAK